MTMIRRTIRLSRLQIFLLSALLSMTLLNNARSGVSSLGFASIAAMLGVAVIIFLELQRNGVGIPRVLVPAVGYSAALVVLYCTTALMEEFSARSVVVVGGLLGLMLFLFSFSMIRWGARQIVNVGLFVLVPLLVVSLVSIVGDHRLNSNVLGGFLAFLLFWPLACYTIARRGVTRLFWGIVVLIGLSGLYASGARSTWLALAGCGAVYLLLTLLPRRRSVHRAVFAMILVSVIAVHYLYIMLPESPLGQRLQMLSRELTGKNMFSGRQVLWPTLIEAISDRPLLGYGATASPERVAGITLSAHNLYLQIALQTGLLGLGALLGLLYSIWKVICLGIENRVARLSAGYLVAIIVHQMFEVSLTQNNLSIGILQWLILAIGMSSSLTSRYDRLAKS